MPNYLAQFPDDFIAIDTLITGETLMTAPIEPTGTPYLDQVTTLTNQVNQLTAALEQSKSNNRTHMRRWELAVAKLNTLFNKLYDGAEEDTIGEVIALGAPEPSHRYKFRIRVIGYAEVSGVGTSEEDAWDNADMSFDYSDVDDLEYSELGDYEEATYLGTDPLSHTQISDYLRSS